MTVDENATPRRTRRLAEGLLGVAAAILLFAIMMVTVIDVIGRYLLSQPLPGAFELTEILLAMAVFIGLPLICLREEHISVTLLTDRLSPQVREIHAAIVSLIGSGVLGVVASQLFTHGRQLASYGDVTVFLRVPKGPLGYVMAACAALAALALVLVAIDHFTRARTAWYASRARRDA
jgi:TRAP-type transport system small permease protein